jgi:hypothetical protein
VKTGILKNSVFVNKLGKTKIWKPSKYIRSRKVPIAESFEELLNI